MRYILPFLVLLFLSCNSTSYVVTERSADLPVKAEREFRAAWIATVANINWPSKPGLSTEEQKKEALDLLNFLQQHNFNAAILQVRPQADALYQSRSEEHTSELQSRENLVCRLLLEKKKKEENTTTLHARSTSA